MKILPVEEVIAYQTARGFLPTEQLPFLQNWVTWHQDMSLGGTDWLDPTMEQLLGKSPKTVKDQAHILFSSGNIVDTKDFAGVD